MKRDTKQRTSQTQVQRLEVGANVESPVCLYKYEIRDTEIVFGDVCIEEYIPLGTPSSAI